jgi:hypothetical protein
MKRKFIQEFNSDHNVFQALLLLNATIGKSDTWYIDQTTTYYDDDECIVLGRNCGTTTSTTSVTSSSSTPFTNQLLNSFINIFPLLFFVSIGSVSGALVAIFLRRFKLN